MQSKNVNGENGARLAAVSIGRQEAIEREVEMPKGKNSM